MEKIKVYFLGSGDIAVPVLKQLCNDLQIELVGIGTQPDKPAGRKRELKSTPIGAWCTENNIDCDKIDNINSAQYYEKLTSLNPDFLLVISFGQLLKKEIINLPKFSCVNVHASLLPKYRGSSPIVAAIANGDKQTGVTFMKIDIGLDTGDIYEEFTIDISPTIKADELEIALGELAAVNYNSVLTKIYNKELNSVPQDNSLATHTKRIKTIDGKISWDLPAEDIWNKFRGYHPWPGIFFGFEGKKGEMNIKLIDIEVVEKSGQPGEVIQADKKGWVIACKNKALKLNRIKPQGRKEMSGQDFIRGNSVEMGQILA